MSTTTKSNRREELESQIAEQHDMQELGQLRQWEACGVQGKERCTICGLTHHWGSRGQNTGSFSRWETFDGMELTLAQAATRGCM